MLIYNTQKESISNEINKAIILGAKMLNDFWFRTFSL